VCRVCSIDPVSLRGCIPIRTTRALQDRVIGLHGAARAFTVPSADVVVCAEAGCLVGVGLMLPGGRRLFVPGANVVAILDGDVTVLTLLR
jgi:hypothetical protein